MASRWFVCVIVAVVLTVAVSGNQNDVLSALQSRLDALEGRVASLSDEVASLDTRLTKFDGHKKEPEPTEFKLVNVSRAVDRARSNVTFTVTYESPEQPQVLMAFNERTAPMEVPHEQGVVSFSVPDSEIAPLLYMRIPSTNVIYTLVLLTESSGPPRRRPEDIPNVILTTTPERFVRFQENHREEQEITITSHVTGPRSVTREKLLYYGYVLDDFIVDFTPASSLYAYSSFDDDHSQDGDDVMSDDVNAVSDDVKRLRLVGHEREREGRETRDKVRLDARHENSGVLFVQKRFEFICQMCALYGLWVTKPLPYFVDDDSYSLHEGTLVAYKDLYNFGADFQGPRYFRFVRYNQSEEAYSFHKTCQQGHPCELFCEVFGDNPSAHFDLFVMSVGRRPAYFDQSGSRLSEDARGSATIKGWSAETGFVAYSVIKFDDVSPEHAGNYDCWAHIAAGISMRRTYILTVV